jgi:CO dehydrogenase maturation factor
MKILICGKGGSGKSTVTAMMALAFNDMGRGVLVVDADDANQGLHRLLGCDRPGTLMDGLGGKQGFRDRLAQPGGSVFPPSTGIADLPASTAPQRPDLRLMAVGKIHHFGEGCACPMGRLFGLLFDRIHPDDGMVVLVDTAAGVEHFGRRLDAAVDRLVAVVDPTAESLELADRIGTLAAEAGKPVHYMLNRVEPDIAHVMTRDLPPDQVLGRIDFNRELMVGNLLGKPLTSPGDAVAAACRQLLEAPAPAAAAPFRLL